MSEATKTAAQAYLRAFSSMDEEGWVASFAPDAEAHDPVGSPPLRGHDGIRRFFREMCAAFDDLELTAESTFVREDVVAVKWRGTGTAHNGRELTFEGIHVFVVDEDGLISRLWGFWDPAALGAELQRI